MNDVFIFHGTGGYPGENWFPWLKDRLEKLGCNVIIPHFPTPENQSLENWFKILKEYTKHYNKNTILIGHSLGGSFLLRALETYEPKIKDAFIVAAPIGIRPIKNYESDRSFLGGFAFDWEKIKSRCGKFFIFHSDSDPYVCLDNGKKLANELSANLLVIPNAGHFNAKSGYLQFDLLLEKIINEL